MIIPKCIAFDFDGVLCDSLDETMVVSYYAYGTLHELNRIHPYSCDHVPQELAKIFFHFRPLVRVAEEYYLLWALILERADLKETEPLCEQAQHIPFPKQQFREIFFQERQNWRANNEASWKRNLSPYPEMKSTLKILKDREAPTFIVSSKDEAAIRQILSLHDVSWRAEDIFGAEKNLDKDRLFQLLLKVKQLSSSELFFLDDNLVNLRLAKRIGIQGAMAAWGYNFKHEQKIALDEGFEIFQLKDIHTRIHYVS